jgi:thioredoxin reductase (NADPH)
MSEIQREEREVYVVGRRSSPHVQEYRDFLERNAVPFRWVDLDRDPLVRLLLGAGDALAGMQLPFFLLEDGRRIDVVSGSDEGRSYTQTLALLAERVGLHVRPSRELYDLAIVGAGPAGLAAAVYAASEGLRTVLLERFAPGGQAGTSSRIENYPGFPDGVSGSAFAEGALRQAIRLGAEVLVGCDWVSIGPEPDGTIRLGLVNGAVLRARAGIGATGSHYRRLEVPGIENLIGSGVYYGARVDCSGLSSTLKSPIQNRTSPVR